MSVKKGISVLLILLPMILNAQKIVSVSGEYIYYPPDTESYEVSKVKALQRAQIQILADKFGTIINSGTATIVSTNDGGNSDVSTFSLGESIVKGEWIETVGEPEFKRIVDVNDMLAIKVTVKGKAREISSSSVDFEAKILRNGVDDKFESLDFNAGDDLYLAFKAPLDGYLAVYLYDCDNTAYCLLPYMSMTQGTLRVMGGEKYVLFSPDKAKFPLEARDVDEFSMTCARPIEINRIYCIYSPNQFSKAVDSKSAESVLPREVVFSDFQKWLTKVRVYDSKMRVRTFDITIKQK